MLRRDGRDEESRSRDFEHDLQAKETTYERDKQGACHHRRRCGFASQALSSVDAVTRTARSSGRHAASTVAASELF
jgi:hypothetical protein